MSPARTCMLVVALATTVSWLPVPAAAVAPTPRSAAAGPAFVGRSGSTLTLHGAPWRFSGVNMYWLGLDENVQDAAGPTYPTKAAIDSGLHAAKSLGATVVRAISLGVSVGSPRTLEPTLDHFNDKAFASIDYAVARARHYGLRLLIPLTDDWHYYHGGKHTFTNWLGYPDVPGQTAASSATQLRLEAAFYTDPAVIAAFHRYVAHLMNHVDRYTKVRFGSDPTIAFWETGNELWDAPAAWTEQTAAYIKTLAPNALVVDGSAAPGRPIDQTGYTQPDVDVVDEHFYPTDTALATSDADTVAAAGKAFVVGEYPATGSDVTTWLGSLAADPNICGALAWSLLPYLANGTPEQHQDGYTFHYPGATPSERTEDSAQLAFARQLAGG